ncbi:MAG TPA: hypothetical protein VLV15_04605 [Dongiaceae bacterium]|nr:hypothetical protein [Dongiaceae bacterium]
MIRRRPRPGPGCAGWIALLALPVAISCAHASAEEFSTFSAIAQEEDDESTIDHMLARAPASWQPDWARSVNALQTNQGCFTSGQWIVDTRLKLETALGERARFGIDYTDYQADDAQYTKPDFLFRWPVARGRITGMFRPFHDKSRQDFGLGWDVGADTSVVRLQAMWVFEDMFNNLWAWRQTRVGEASEPYTRHPYEPNLQFAIRRPGFRVEVTGRYLTPSVKQVHPTGDPNVFQVATLWGTLAEGNVAFDALGATWHLGTYNKQARSEDAADSPTGDVGADFRRQWWVVGGLDHPIWRRARVSWRWTYMERGQGYTPPLGVGLFHSIDRVQHIEVHGEFRPTFGYRLGWMHDHIDVRKDPGVPGFTYGTRGENRLYLGLDLQFAKVRTGGIEGIELDREPYEVSHHHDKGFLGLQSVF